MKHSDIPSFKDDSIDINLKSLIQEYVPKTILEVGVGLGSSTWNILDSISSDCLVASMDKFEFGPEDYRLEKIKNCPTYYEQALTDRVIVQNSYDHYLLYKWCLTKHSKYVNLTILKEDIFSYINYGNNVFDLVFLDNQKHIPVLKPQLDFFEKSKVICGTGFTNEHNAIDITNYVKQHSKRYQVRGDFWFIVGV